jgi:hypothetical protein
LPLIKVVCFLSGNLYWAGSRSIPALKRLTLQHESSGASIMLQSEAV